MSQQHLKAFIIIRIGFWCNCCWDYTHNEWYETI